MDSVIHYDPHHAVEVLAKLAANVRHGMLFTFAPRTPLLAVMHAVGGLFPRGDRAPAIVPIGEKRLHGDLAGAPGLKDWQRGRSHRVKSGFYTSQACELRRQEASPG
jgi:magnesium-protoporphyrin O-methyltransferase